jgi:hypothetical protein
MKTMRVNRLGRRASSALLVVLGAGLLAVLMQAPLASAAPAAADQYAPGPTQQIIGPASAGNGPSAGAPGSGPVFSEPGEAGGGELPFTGYPLTPLILIVLALLAAGLIARAMSASAERRRERRAVSS